VFTIIWNRLADQFQVIDFGILRTSEVLEECANNLIWEDTQIVSRE
jgi:hypothetical protein